MTEQHARARDTVDGDGLPPRPSPEASGAERARTWETRHAARFGAPTIEHFRHAYEGSGVEWPGDDEIRRRHLVADAS